jgi:integrase
VTDQPTKGRGGRPRKGHLEQRGKFWWCQLTVTVDGESVRRWFNLHTESKPAARRKMARMIVEFATGATMPAIAESAKRAETFGEAAKRCNDARVADGVSSAKDEHSQLKRYAADLADVDVTQLTTEHVNAALDGAKAAGLGRLSVQHLKQNISNVFAMLKREGAVSVNPCVDAELPKFKKEVRKVRTVLTDQELVRFLVWVHPEEHQQMATLERQVMACVARMFGGLRTGDMHGLDWSSLDTENGRFAMGWAPRQKTKAPQALEIPAMLRPILADWWTRTGRKDAGPVFPSRRGERAGEERKKSSHAKAFRRDLRRAFGIDERHAVVVKRSNNRPLTKYVWKPVRELTARERELFEEGRYTLPVDFHSWRRAYAQALADADVNAQQAQALAGHASLAAHQRYLTNATKLRSIPDAALPRIGVSHHVLGETGVTDDPVANENSEISGGRDRGRTCDIRYVNRASDSESSTIPAGSFLLGDGAKTHKTPGNGSDGAKLRGETPNRVETALSLLLRARADEIAAALN